MTQTFDVVRLERSLAWALKHELPSRELVRLLRPLVQATAVASASGRLARLQLAEQLLRSAPDRAAAWEAALLAKSVLAYANHEDIRRRALGVRGLASTVLGFLRAARRAYKEALASDPSDPICAHNLGHLEIVHFGALARGLHWLRVAHAELPDDPEIAGSLAHALCLAGRREGARAVLSRALGDERAEQLLDSWRSAEGERSA